ncbi:hypothetical protein RD792_008760 [Penstemon davidsonii]|uniref:Uncharacterized protein n=1 Tax=Penstemon davidsonii TaxID=160366 RepID=A0ABR0DA89_9LAMI|nr:hypothetical protein RD792_008760 [Penstemon davidsonii]
MRRCTVCCKDLSMAMVSIFNTGVVVPICRRKAALMSDYSKLNYWPHRKRRSAAVAPLELDHYLETSKELMRWEKSGPPRWFTPLECGSRAKASPVLFFLPGIDGSGLGLQLHHKKLGEIFDIWCLHIPFSDRTPLTDLVKLVEAAIMSEHERTPERPIYLVGESLGACLALVVAAQNPQIDLILILANPGRGQTSSPAAKLSDQVVYRQWASSTLAIIKCSSYYRRGAYTDYVLDFLQPSPSEIKAIYEPYSGKMVRGLTGIPTKGPILFVGNHMMLGMDLVPLLSRFWIEQNITVRTMAHPAMFKPDLSMFDMIRILGGAPGEDYKLIWPEEPEFVRMAARFGAKIIPFGAVGEDDVGQLLLDCDDQMKIPPLKAFIEELTDEAVRLRTDDEGEVGKQYMHYPVILPKFPGRFYFLFGKPIATEGMNHALKDKDKAQAMYSEIKYEIQKCIALLKDKREKDPYRNLLARLAYQGYYGFDSQVPTFQI